LLYGLVISSLLFQNNCFTDFHYCFKTIALRIVLLFQNKLT
jgi:hypothetical protein